SRVRGTDQRLRQCAGCCRGDDERAVDRHDARFRAGPAVLLSTRAARPTDRGPQIRTPTHRHSGAHVRVRRRVLGGLSRARSRWVPDVRHGPCTGVRHFAEPSRFHRGHQFPESQRRAAVSGGRHDRVRGHAFRSRSRHVPLPHSRGGVRTGGPARRPRRSRSGTAGGVVPMTQVLIRSGGLYTTVQDTGRFGYYHMGMPPSGAMDVFSAVVANLAVGNPDGAGVLEATSIGPKLEFTDDRLVCVTGADAPVTLNDDPVEPWTALRVGPGDVLGFAMIQAGCRVYIAVSGGVDVPVYLGSRSTYTLTGIGGHEGRKLHDDETLPLGEPGNTAHPGATVPSRLRPPLENPAELRTMVGLCSYRLTEH